MTRKDSNKITLDAYDSHVGNYLQQTPAIYSSKHAPLTRWIDEILSHVKPNGHVLEIGSATPRDAQYIRSKNFSVQCSDGAPNFVRHLQDLGEPALTINVTEDTIEGPYDLVFANAVFPHLTNDDTVIALRNIYQALEKDGILAFNVKQGEDEEWVNEKFEDRRYINYWQPHEIYEAVISCNYTIIALEDGVSGDLPTHVWTRVIARKA